MFVNDTFAFGNSTLISGYLNTFAVDFANQVIFDGWSCSKILPQLLYSSMVGRHTNVVHLSGGTTSTDSSWKLSAAAFLWTHPTCRPNGEALPSQCELCRHYRPWKIPAGSTPDKPVVLTCRTKRCDGKHIIPALAGFTEVGNHMVGVWQKVELNLI